jgi:cation transport regulator
MNMPYKNLEDLPERVQNNLPKHAQEIYLKAFNNAWDQYKEPKERRGNESRETTSHKVAWSAVKQKYKKNKSGNWVKK